MFQRKGSSEREPLPEIFTKGSDRVCFWVLLLALRPRWNSPECFHSSLGDVSGKEQVSTGLESEACFSFEMALYVWLMLLDFLWDSKVLE